VDYIVLPSAAAFFAATENSRQILNFC